MEIAERRRKKKNKKHKQIAVELHWEEEKGEDDEEEKKEMKKNLTYQYNIKKQIPFWIGFCSSLSVGFRCFSLFYFILPLASFSGWEYSAV